MNDSPARALRRDAAENAERVMAAAIRAGLNQGKHVPLAQIAADAGVGVGTLYRRYSNRDALIEALEVRAYRLLIAEAERALETGTSGLDAVDRYLTSTFEFRDELVLPLHGAPVTPDSESAQLGRAILKLLGKIVDRGHADGSVRPQVSARTVVRFGALLAHPMSSAPGWTSSARELRAIFLRGIAAPGAS